MKLLVAIAIAALVAVAISAPFAETHPHGSIRITDRLGPDTHVPPLDFATAVASCPRGYVATGGGSYAGAIEHVTDGRTANGKGWFVDGFNPSDTRTFPHNAFVVCARGAGRHRPRVVAANAQSKIKAARREFLAARRD